MKPRDLRELLGGYAAGTLTAEEREALFQAALENQALFDALAGEEALRELLADPACRAQLLRDLDQQPAAFWQRFAQWMGKPATLAFAGSAAALVLVIGVVRFTQREPAAPKLVAQAPRQVELPPPASPIRQLEPKLMRPTTPPAETQAGQVRQEPAAQATAATPQPAVPKLAAQAPRQVELAPPAQTEVGQVRQEPATPAPAAAPQPQALSCTVLARSSQGDWIEAAPDATFREGAEVRLRVRSAEDGAILVTARDGATVTMLTPATGATVGSGQDLILPPAGSFELAGASGEKNLRISFLPRSPAAPVTAFQFAKSAAAPAARGKGETADSAAAPAAAASANAVKSGAAPAAKRKVEAADRAQALAARTSADAADKAQAPAAEARANAAKGGPALAARRRVDAAQGAAAPAAGARADAADRAQAPAVGARAEASKRKADTAESREEAAKPPQVIELRLVYRSK